MSEGDKACVIAMLQNAGARQMTSIGCYHDKFYEELSKYGWAESAEISPEIEKTDSVRSWKFTEVGAGSMPTLLLALTTTGLRNKLRDNRCKELTMFCAKLFICYVLCQLIVFSVGLMIGKMEVNISLIREYLSIVGLLLSILAGLYFASKVWIQKDHNEERVRNIAYYEFLNSETQLISILFAVIVFILHLIFEFAGMQLEWQNETKSFTRLLVQYAILSGAVWWISKTFLPKITKTQRNKQFQAKKRP